MTEKNLEDIILIQNILEGDKKSEEILYEKYKKILIDYLRKKYPQNSECEDDVSEILIKVFFSLSNFDSNKSKFKTWVFSIAKNYMIDKSRCSNKPHLSDSTITINNTSDNFTLDNSTMFTTSSDTTSYYVDNELTSFTSNNCDIINFENSVSVNYVSEQLSSCDFSFLNMHYVYGYSYCEIGSEFNLSSNTISNRVNYIKDKLKKNNNNEIIF